MRVFKDFEKEYLEQFLAEQPNHDGSVLALDKANPKISSKVLENYLSFNKSGISARLNCVYTDPIEQLKGKHFSGIFDMGYVIFPEIFD